jgi:mannose/fructose/N-acetylgalactosamine-specific phosphotransferase system component IIB
MKNILVTRIDDRLIHGQVMTAWVKSYPINHILIVDDELSKNQFMLSVYKSAMPAGIKVSITDRANGVALLKQDPLPGENYLILVKVPEVVAYLLDNGIPLTKLVVGGMGAKPGRKTLIRNVSANDEERACLKALEGRGVHTVYQLVPADKEIPLAGSL